MYGRPDLSQSASYVCSDIVCIFSIIILNQLMTVRLKRELTTANALMIMLHWTDLPLSNLVLFKGSVCNLYVQHSNTSEKEYV